MNEYSLTPVQEVDGLRIKRDDLYAPFGPGEVNGGKLRQCVMLVNSVNLLKIRNQIENPNLNRNSKKRSIGLSIFLKKAI